MFNCNSKDMQYCIRILVSCMSIWIMNINMYMQYEYHQYQYVYRDISFLWCCMMYKSAWWNSNFITNTITMTTHNYYKKAITWNQQLGASPRPQLPQALTFRSHLPHRHYCRSDLLFAHPLKQEEETTDKQTHPPPTTPFAAPACPAPLFTALLFVVYMPQPIE